MADFENIYGPLPGGWEMTSIGALCTKGAAELQTGPFGTMLHAQSYRITGTPVVAVKNIGSNRLIDDEIPRVDDETSDRLSRYRLQEGDILFGRKGAVDRRAYVRREQDGWLQGSDCIRLRMHGPKVNARFISYVLGTPQYINWIIQNAQGATMPSLNQEIISRIPLPMPPIPQQQAIACFLGSLDDKIELNRRMNETLEGIARAIFKSWFVDFDPVRAKAEGRDPGLPKHIADLFPDEFEDSELGPIPKGWEAVTLDNVVAIYDSIRIPLSSRERAKRIGYFPYYGATGVLDYVDDFLFNGIYVLMGEDGSVVKENGTPFVQYVWGKFWVNNHAHVLRAKNPMSNEQLKLFLDQVNIAPFVTGAVQQKLNQKNMKSIPFIKASDTICEEFGKLVAPLYSMLRQKTEESQILSSLRDTLLPKLLSGELRVQDAEKLAGAVL